MRGRFYEEIWDELWIFFLYKYREGVAMLRRGHLQSKKHSMIAQGFRKILLSFDDTPWY
jgi:hypothetical protein